ncbi:MAG: 3-phosphoshikimate 1-carboxyvinyltransferase [Dehalococcoidia bacterium]|nr:3-phosphoshikimate 1-carboxyvinyltransferase [Dehalococcoidia bacterium]
MAPRSRRDDNPTIARHSPILISGNLIRATGTRGGWTPRVPVLQSLKVGRRSSGALRHWFFTAEPPDLRPRISSSQEAPLRPDILAIEPATGPIDATVTLPGSKSYTNRALIIAAMAEGRSVLRHALFSDDTDYMAAALRTLGIGVTEDRIAEEFRVNGSGGRLAIGAATLFIGNAGTAARFLTSLVALGHGRYVIDGVERMRQRPIQPLLDGLTQLGVRAVSERGTGCPPLVVEAGGFEGGRARMRGDISSQYFSSLLMVAPLSRRGVELEVEGELVSKPYIDMTASTMAAFGATMENHDYRRFSIPCGQSYQARTYDIEPDASGASYFFAAAAVTGGRVRVDHLGSGSAQGDLGFVRALEQMGCTVSQTAGYTEVTGPTELKGVDIDMGDISDTAQTLAAIAPFASGPVNIRNIAHVRAKETDRVAAVATELRRLGATVDERPDGLAIHPAALHPADIETYDDHRMAMSFAVAGLRVPGLRIKDPGCVSKTFPDFWERFARLRGL